MVGLSGDLPMMQLQDIARDVADAIQLIDGVSEVDIHGEREKEIWVELNPRRMAAYNISIKEVAAAVANRAKNLPGGTLEMGRHETAIRMLGEPRDPKELEGLIRYARAEGARALLVQPQFYTKSARTIANALNGRVMVADPLARDWKENLLRVAKMLREILQ